FFVCHCYFSSVADLISSLAWSYHLSSSTKSFLSISPDILFIKSSISGALLINWALALFSSISENLAKHSPPLTFAQTQFWLATFLTSHLPFVPLNSIYYFSFIASPIAGPTNVRIFF